MTVPAFRSLRAFLDFLSARGELAVIDREVDPHLEICEIADRVMKQPGGGKALLFTRVRGSELPVAVNVWGSERRIAWALGAETLSEIEERVRKLLDVRPPTGWRDALSMAGRLLEARHALPRRVRRAPCQEIVEREVDLGRLPVLTTWPDDGGPFVTLPMVFTRDPDGRRNCGMYRMQVFDARSTGMHWQRHKDGRRHADARGGGRLEVAVALGGPPALTYAASAPLPPEIFEMLFAGYLQRRRVPMVRCRTVDLEVPAEADIVLEGWVDPGETRIEGPFGDHTGYYSQADQYPVFHVECVTRRRDAIYPATIVGKPPMEDAYLGLATERLFLPMVQKVLGELSDLRLPVECCFHNLALVSIRKHFPGHARKTVSALWGLGQMMFTKAAVAVDADVALRDYRGILDVIDKNWWSRRDTLVSSGPLDTLDHASGAQHLGGKIALDATRKIEQETVAELDARGLDSTIPGGKVPVAASAQGPSAGARTDAAVLGAWTLDRDRFPEVRALRVPAAAGGHVALVAIDKRAARAGRDLLGRLRAGDMPPETLLVLVFDELGPLETLGEAALVASNNVDPARDAVFLGGPDEAGASTTRPGGALGLDATRKGDEEGYGRGAWPALIVQDPAVVARVESYWKELGL